MKERLGLDIVKEGIEDAFLPLHCTFETKFLNRKKCLFYTVLDEKGVGYLTGMCSPKIDNEFPAHIARSRETLEQDGFKLYPWESPFE